jgi:hypothetical protein
MQLVADGQEMPDSTSGNWGGEGSTGTVWFAHRLPFQRSANGVVPIAVWKEPTASHAAVEKHETPFNELELAPGSFGVDWTDQPPAAAALGAPQATATNTTTAATINRHPLNARDTTSMLNLRSVPDPRRNPRNRPNQSQCRN